MRMLSSEVVDFIQGGQDARIATSNATREPYGCRVLAAVADDDGAHLTVFVPEAAAPPILANLRANPAVALAFQRPTDDRACQVKGTVVETRAATDHERAIVERQLGLLGEKFGELTVPWVMVAGWTTWPAVAVMVRVSAVFDQTPGPGAGAPLS
ncbi:MAG: pyridoxamine 5'-phosphate oxidase family protein [Vicinamibacterales bacterium]